LQHLSMKNSVVLVALCCVFGALAQDAEAPVIPERQMNVRQGPETVFDRPPADMLPALAGARATGENGRVGSELVFWGYEQGDGRRVFLFACAPRPDLDCATRVPAICPVTTTVLETLEASGTQGRRNCRNIAIAGPGDTRPGCDDRDEATNLDVGLVSCG
jgi:hypothetical protein